MQCSWKNAVFCIVATVTGSVGAIPLDVNDNGEQICRDCYLASLFCYTHPIPIDVFAGFD